jgi:hypothetical protein
VTFTGTGAQRNLSAVTFTFTTSIGAVSHLGLFDAATGGNPLTWAPLSAPVTVAGPGTITIAADALTITPG